MFPLKMFRLGVTVTIPLAYIIEAFSNELAFSWQVRIRYVVQTPEPASEA